jgi:hypothetical protein
MPKPTKPNKSPKQMIVETRRAEAAAAALEQDLAAARGRGAPDAGTIETAAKLARAAAAARKAEHNEGIAAWEAYQTAEEEERRAAEEARIAEIRAQVWPEGGP